MSGNTGSRTRVVLNELPLGPPEGNKGKISGKYSAGRQTMARRPEHDLSLGPAVDPTDRRLAAAALRYAAEGWAVFPFRGTSKRPRTRHGHHDATNDVATVEQWWRWNPFDNIGARMPNGLIVLDLDRHGDDSTHWSQFTPDDFCETLTTETGTGWHLWFRGSACELRSTSEVAGWQGVELKHHAVVVPPSVHGNGTRYAWRRHPVATLPALVAEAFWRRPMVAHATRQSSGAYVAAARAGVVADLTASAGPGNHHHPLLRAAYRFRDLGLSAEDAIADLVPVVTATGHDQAEAHRTAASCWR